MGKKKREHIVFDQMLKTKKQIPFSKINKQGTKKQWREEARSCRLGMQQFIRKVSDSEQ